VTFRVTRAASSPRVASPGAWPGRRSIAIAVGGLIAAAAVWWFAGGEPLNGAVARIADPVAAAAPSVAPRTAAVARSSAPAPLPVIAPEPPRAPGLSTDDPLTAYRKANVYPPTSRPLTADQLDLLRPNRRHEAMRRDDHDDGVSYLFTADRYFVIGDETLTATLEVRRDGAPIAVAITEAYAAVVGADGRPAPALPLAFAAQGPTSSTVLVPARLGLARQTALSIYLEFDHGDGRQRAQLDLQYTPERGIPARFTGSFRDGVEAGSLVVHAGIDLAAAGNYVIDCNLFDAGDQPVAWSRFKGELGAGVREADLVFFGKILVDARAHGPFHIGQLRGARFAPGLDPDLEQIPPFTGSFATAAYPTDAFSDAEYDSPEKQKMIQLLGQDRNHQGGAGRGAGV
jgi:hypothetical protein